MSKWISVDERLPEMWREVVIYDRKRRYVTTASYDGNEWSLFGVVVTHWQPLPEPPEET